MTKQEAKEQIVTYFRMMYRNGMVNLFEGNVSMRWEDRFLITPSQQNKETMTAAEILEVDAQGNLLAEVPGFRPSSEMHMHLEVYRLRPDVQACVHNHSVFATAYAAAGQPICSCGVAESNVVFGTIPVVPYGRPGTADIYKAFPEYLSEYSALLLENHGVLTMGPDLTLAYSMAEAVEKIAKLLVITRLLGGEKSLPEKELNLLREHGRQIRRKLMGL